MFTGSALTLHDIISNEGNLHRSLHDVAGEGALQRRGQRAGPSGTQLPTGHFIGEGGMGMGSEGDGGKGMGGG